MGRETKKRKCTSKMGKTYRPRGRQTQQKKWEMRDRKIHRERGWERHPLKFLARSVYVSSSLGLYSQL